MNYTNGNNNRFFAMWVNGVEIKFWDLPKELIYYKKQNILEIKSNDQSLSVRIIDHQTTLIQNGSGVVFHLNSIAEILKFIEELITDIYRLKNYYSLRTIEIDHLDGQF